MVQEKDAALKRKESMRAMLDRHAKELEKNTLAFKWAVIEHTPGYNTGGYYDTDVPAKNVVVSDYFKTEAEAQTWMDAHEPDKGNKLFIQRYRLLRRVYEEWVSY